jgi:hypothetical protein
MSNKVLLLASACSLALSTTAIAGQPMTLSDAQMDRVVAGAIGSATSLADALGNLQAQTLTFHPWVCGFGSWQCSCARAVNRLCILTIAPGNSNFQVLRDRAYALITPRAAPSELRQYQTTGRLELP